MKNLLLNKKIFLGLLLVLVITNSAKAQNDTIPPVFGEGCGDTSREQILTTWILKMPEVTDNQSTKDQITLTTSWGASGALNTQVPGLYELTIEATDANGNKTKCVKYYLVGDFIPPASSVKEISIKGFLVYPNPANDNIRVTTGTACKIMLMTVEGKMLLESDSTNEIKIETSGLSNGVYLLVAQNANGLFTRKLVVQH